MMMAEERRRRHWQMSHINDETTTQVAEVDSLTTTVNLMFLYSGGTHTLAMAVPCGGGGGGRTDGWMQRSSTCAISKKSANFKEEKQKTKINFQFELWILEFNVVDQQTTNPLSIFRIICACVILFSFLRDGEIGEKPTIGTRSANVPPTRATTHSAGNRIYFYVGF